MKGTAVLECRVQDFLDLSYFVLLYFRQQHTKISDSCKRERKFQLGLNFFRNSISSGPATYQL